MPALSDHSGAQKVTGESYSASYIDQFANGTEGIYVGFAHRENPYEGQQFQSWGDATAPDGNLIMGGMKIYDQNDLLKSNSGTVVIESKPNDTIHSKIDLFLSCTNENQLLRGMEVPMSQWGPAALQPGYTVTNGLITQSTITHVNPVLRAMDTGWLSHLASGVWNLDIAEKSEWPLHFTMGYSQATQSNEVLETYAGLYFANSEPANQGATFQVSNPAGPNPPSVTSNNNFANGGQLFLTDPDGYGTGVYPVSGMEGYLKYFKEKDVLDSYKLSTKHEIDGVLFKDVELGASFTERFKQYGQNPSGYLVNANGQPTAPLPPLEGTTNLSFIGNLTPVAWDPNQEYNSGLVKFMPNPNPGSWYGDNYRVWEEVTRPFVMFDLKTTMFGVPVDGNIGIMYSWADQNSAGFSGNGGPIVTPVTGSAGYGNVLPSLNLVFHLTSQDLIRFSVGREEMRPTMYQMRAARDYGYNATNAASTTISPWSATSGNPSIRPWLSDSVDLSLEHYFAHGGGYFALSVFAKDLLTYIYQAQTVESFAGYPYTSSTPPAIFYGVASQYVNGSGGTLSGVEANLQITSEVLTRGAIKGFGVQLNAAVIDSRSSPGARTIPARRSPTCRRRPRTSPSTTSATASRPASRSTTRARRGSTSCSSAPRILLGSGSPDDGYSKEIPYQDDGRPT